MKHLTRARADLMREAAELCRAADMRAAGDLLLGITVYKPRTCGPSGLLTLALARARLRSQASRNIRWNSLVARCRFQGRIRQRLRERFQVPSAIRSSLDGYRP